MNEEIIVGALSLTGTLIGTLGGIIAANKLTNYRIEQLERKVDKHNSIIERTYRLEHRMGLVDEQLRATDRLIESIRSSGRHEYAADKAPAGAGVRRFSVCSSDPPLTAPQVGKAPSGITSI